MHAVKVQGLAHPVIVSNQGRQPVVAQGVTGLGASNTPTAKQFPAIKSVATTRQPN